MPVFRCLMFALGLAAFGAQAGTRVLPPGAVLVDAGTAKADVPRLALASGEILARIEAAKKDLLRMPLATLVREEEPRRGRAKEVARVLGRYARERAETKNEVGRPAARRR